MKEKFEKIKKTLFHATIFGIVSSVIICFSLFLFLKARSDSSGGLTVDSSSPASLYVGNNETLTAAKRNRLVQKSNREEVPTTDTALFNPSCDRKLQGARTHSDILYAGNVRGDGTVIHIYADTGYYYLNYDSKGTIRFSGGGTKTTLHIRKKCN